MYVDSHAHIEMGDFNQDRDEVIQRALDAGIDLIVDIGDGDVSHDSHAAAFKVAEQYPFIFTTVGVHPHEARLLDERYELLQRTMVGDVLAEVLTGHLYPEDLQARLRPFGIGEQVAVLAFRLADASAGAAVVEGALARERVPSLVAIRAGLLCAVIDPDGVIIPILLDWSTNQRLPSGPCTIWVGVPAPEGNAYSVIVARSDRRSSPSKRGL